MLVTNIRQFQNQVQTRDALQRVLEGMEKGVTGDFLAMDIRQSLNYLGEITGTITTDDLLENILSRFCIGEVKTTHSGWNLVEKDSAGSDI